MSLEGDARAAERAVLAKVAEALGEKLVLGAEVLGHDGEGAMTKTIFVVVVAASKNKAKKLITMLPVALQKL